jgi:hypothetical protein
MYSLKNKGLMGMEAIITSHSTMRVVFPDCKRNSKACITSKQCKITGMAETPDRKLICMPY